MTVYTYDIAPAAARGRLQAPRRTISEVGGVAGPGIAGAIISVSSTGLSFLALAPAPFVRRVPVAGRTRDRRKISRTRLA